MVITDNSIRSLPNTVTFISNLAIMAKIFRYLLPDTVILKFPICLDCSVACVNHSTIDLVYLGISLGNMARPKLCGLVLLPERMRHVWTGIMLLIY